MRDLFALGREHDRYELVVEHCCFCAIDPARRDEYVDVVADVLVDGGVFVGLFRTSVGKPVGPPFAVARAEVERLFARRFELVDVSVPEDSIEARRGAELLVRMTRRADAGGAVARADVVAVHRRRRRSRRRTPARARTGAGAALVGRAGDGEEPGARRRRSGRARSQGAEDDLGTLGPLRPAADGDVAAAARPSGDAAAGHARGGERLGAAGLARPLSAGGTPSLLLQAVRARRGAAGARRRRQGQARGGDEGARRRRGAARRDLPEEKP